MRNTSILLIALQLLTACSSVPESLQGSYPQTPDVPAVQARPEAYVGTRIRWGGIVVGVENLAEYSVLEILAYPLDSSTRPILNQVGLGRFLFRIRGFYDPTIYARNRELTAIGTIKGIQKRMIGEYDYHYPLIDGQTLHLWPMRMEIESEFHDPWYPGYLPPWGYPYPWYRPYPVIP